MCQFDGLIHARKHMIALVTLSSREKAKTEFRLIESIVLICSIIS